MLPLFLSGEPHDGQRAAPAGPAPFVIEHGRADVRGSGAFTPSARIVLTPALRTGGLLAALPGEEVKSLLFLLTFVTPNGRIKPSLPEVAQAMRVGEGKAKDRLLRLQTFLWQGEPLVRSRQRELGLDAYTLAPTLVAVQPVPELPEPAPSAPPPLRAAGRDAIIAHSRGAYARPRAEVERIVSEQLGHAAGSERGAASRPDGPEADAYRRLLALGVSYAQADALVRSHPLRDIENQLDWLAHRHAKNPARLIVAAIEHQYEPPAYIRLQQALAAEQEVERAREQSEQNEPAEQPAGHAEEKEGERGNQAPGRENSSHPEPSEAVAAPEPDEVFLDIPPASAVGDEGISEERETPERADDDARPNRHE